MVSLHNKILILFELKGIALLIKIKMVGKKSKIGGKDRIWWENADLLGDWGETIT